MNINMTKDEQTKLITLLSQCMNQSFNNNLNNKFTEELATGMYTIIDRKITSVIQKHFASDDDENTSDTMNLDAITIKPGANDAQ